MWPYVTWCSERTPFWLRTPSCALSPIIIDFWCFTVFASQCIWQMRWRCVVVIAIVIEQHWRLEAYEKSAYFYFCRESGGQIKSDKNKRPHINKNENKNAAKTTTALVTTPCIISTMKCVFISFWMCQLMRALSPPCMPIAYGLLRWHFIGKLSWLRLIWLMIFIILRLFRVIICFTLIN